MPPASIRKGIKAAKKARNAAFKETDADYGVAASANVAALANYKQQMSMYSGGLTAATRRSKTNLKKLAKKGEAVLDTVNRQAANATNTYGSYLGQSRSQLFGPASATGLAAAAYGAGLNARGGLMQKATNTTLQVSADQAKAMQAAGTYALAQAKQARYAMSADQYATTVADLYKQQLAFEQQKALEKYKQQLADKEASGGVAGVTSVVEASTGHASGLFELLNTEQEGGTYLNPGAAAQQYISEQGIVDENEAKLVYALASKLGAAGVGYTQVNGEWVPKEGGIGASGTGGVGIDQVATQAVTQTFSQLYPQMWKKHDSDILAVIDTSYTDWSATSQAALAGNTGEGESGFVPEAGIDTAVGGSGGGALAPIIGGIEAVADVVQGRTKGVVSVQQVRDAAKKAGISYDAMKKKIQQQGYAIR